MPKLTVVDRLGKEYQVTSKADISVMEVIRNSDFGELQALCGGSCSCATCHVYVESTDLLLTPMSKDEHDLLDTSDHRRKPSRLSCQIQFTDQLDGLKVRLAPDD